jgi:hypothetical protein
MRYSLFSNFSPKARIADGEELAKAKRLLPVQGVVFAVSQRE